MKHALGIDLGGTELRVALVAETGAIISQYSAKTAANDGPAAVLEQKTLHERHHIKLEGIGVGSPGPLDPFEGIVIHAADLRNWINVPPARDDF
jgi:glucokinase